MISQAKTPHRVYEQEGIIYRIGIDYVDLLQDDKKISRVLTKWITNIKWVDPHCRNKCLDNLDFEKACKHNKHKHDRHCSNCNKKHQNCNCHNKKDQIKDPVIPYCDGRIHLRLAGLTNNLPYELFRHKGCRVVLELSGESN